ncbi:MAG: hypothetical protein JNL21_17465 [Myxococcales bacterium]|nr:hypothetical protein [Myxococcales bacterium]
MSETRAAHARIATLVSTLDGLVGAHLDTLAEMFLRGALVEPEELGELPRGKLLALAGTEPAHLALRPMVKAVSRAFSLWEGVVFDHGGTAGANRFAGREGIRFKVSRGASRLDAGPALVLSYEEAPWPFRGLHDELRLIAPGLAVGPTYYHDDVVAWFGLEANA